LDLSPDGKRVVAVSPVESAEAPKQEHELVFLQNFADELQRQVPGGKEHYSLISAANFQFNKSRT
jgi:hypothetical protein